MNFTAGDHRSIDFTDADGNARTLVPHGGVFRTDDSVEISVLRSFGLTERSDAQVAATKRSSKTRAEAGKKTGKVVQITGSGTIDTRGPGAPADEDGIEEV